MAGCIYPHTLLSLDPPSRVVHSMGNSTRKEWPTCTARGEHLQATPCWSILRSCLPRVVELQRTTVFHNSLVRPLFPLNHSPPLLTPGGSFQDVQKLSPMDTSIRFIPESL